MPRRRSRKKKPKPRWRAVRLPVPGKAQVAVRLAVVLLVLLFGLLLHLQVSLSRSFEGRLWLLPSKVYSDVLPLAPGDRLRPSALVARLERSGYARTSGAPTRPGQFRQDGAQVEAHVRPFRAAGHDEPARRLRIRFRRDEVRSIEDESGILEKAVLEPEPIATLFGPRQEERDLVRLEQVPDVVRRAVLAAEDSRFYEHHGLDLKGIARAARVNLSHRKIVQGGSTITQQTVKNLFLGQERTWWRKIREGLMSVLLDARYAKDRILEVYLNEVYLGQRGPVAICGIQAAARFYFGRDQRDLSLAEAALLAGLISSPGRFNPFVDPAVATGRRDQVLQAMRRLGWISEVQLEAALSENLDLARGATGFVGAGYAVDFVRSQLSSLYSSRILQQEGLSIYTTLDTGWQRHAEEALRSGLERLDARANDGRRALEGALIVTDPSTGALLAMVGGRDYARSQFNRAVQARRQPGSCFKPFVYAAGFEQSVLGRIDGLTPASMLEDAPFEMESGGELWRPENYDRTYRGPVSARRSLEQSLNVPTVRAAQLVGLDQVVAGARSVGIDSPLPAVPSLALGAVEVSAVELAAAYGTLARMGRRGPVWAIREVTDQHGTVLARPQVRWGRAISPEAAYLVNDVLRGVLQRGTGRSARALGYRGGAAGKTGTTDDTRDAWFVGYTDHLLALVWVGYDDFAETGLTGATGALPIWVDLMRRGEADDLEPDFPVPRGIVLRRIDPETGGLMQRGCPTWKDELFVSGTEPTEPCPEHGGRFRRWFRKLRDRDR